MAIEVLHPFEYAHTELSSPEELQAHLDAGVLDQDSFDHYQAKHDHFVEVAVRNPDGTLKQLRLSGNLRTNDGGDWQSITMGGGVYYGASGIGSAASATALYASSAVNSFTASAAAGYTIFCGPSTAGAGATVFGRVGNNSASCTYIPVDKWYSAASSIGTQTGATPNAVCTWQIVGQPVAGRFIGLSNTAGSPSSTDNTLPGENTSGDLGRAEATYAHAATTGSAAATQTATYTLAKTFTASATTNVLRAAVFGSAVASTGPTIFSNTFTAVSMDANDTVAVTWTIAT